MNLLSEVEKKRRLAAKAEWLAANRDRYEAEKKRVMTQEFLEGFVNRSLEALSTLAVFKAGDRPSKAVFLLGVARARLDEAQRGLEFVARYEREQKVVERLSHGTLEDDAEA